MSGEDCLDEMAKIEALTVFLLRNPQVCLISELCLQIQFDSFSKSHICRGLLLLLLIGRKINVFGPCVRSPRGVLAHILVMLWVMLTSPHRALGWHRSLAAVV